MSEIISHFDQKIVGNLRSPLALTNTLTIPVIYLKIKKKVRSPSIST